MADDVSASHTQDERRSAPVGEDLFGGDLPIATALEKLRTRLLDLTSRNRLLNYRHPKGKSLQAVSCDIGAVFHRLISGKRCSFVPVPVPGKLEYEGPRPDARIHAENLGWDVSVELRPQRTDVPTTSSTGMALRVLQYPEDLDRLLRALYREARLAIEETGSNMLYLVFGFLEFQEAPHSERTFSAPLIAMPVALEREGKARADGLKRFELFFTGDDFGENLTLREKLREEFGLYLPPFEDDDTAENYLTKIEELAQSRIGWRVKRQISLALLSFGKLALWADLDTQRWPELATHPALKTLIQGNTAELGTPLEEHNTELHPTVDGLIFDADSSQHVALIDVLNGRNLVIDGPPGTGKSQTIANLISAAMAVGKNVLFVSEKMAALEVVKSRLEKAGLGALCLDLHSHKTQKKQVLEDLQFRMQLNFPEPSTLTGKLASLRERRAELSRYCELLNLVTGNAMGLSIFDIYWAADRRRAALGDLAGPVESITIEGADRIVPEEILAKRSLVERLVLHYAELSGPESEHPWHGFFATRLEPRDDVEISKLLQAHVAAARSLESERQSFLDTTQAEEAAGSREYCDRLRHALERLPMPGPDVDGDLVAQMMPGQARPLAYVEHVVDRFCGTLRELRRLTQTSGDGLASPESATDATLEHAGAALRALRVCGLDRKPVAESATKAAQLRDLLAQTQKQFADMEALSHVAGVAVERSTRGIARLSKLVSACASAPRELLAYRATSLAEPIAMQRLAQAQQECTELSNALARAEKRFFLDTQLDENELHRALQTFREGDGLLRWLSSDYRAARRFYRLLCRDKERPFEAASAAEDLADLIKVRASHREFIQNIEYKETFGPFYKGLATDFEAIEQLVLWYAVSVEELCGVVESPADTLTNLPATSVRQIAGSSTDFEAIFARLSVLGAELRALLAGSDVTNADWDALLVFGANTAKTWELAYAVLAPLAAAGATPIGVCEALQAQLALPAARFAAESDSEAESLLGPYFAGPNSDVEPITAAWKWAYAYAQAEMPPDLTHHLLTRELPERLQWISAASTRMHSLWTELDKLPTSLSRFGVFDAATWMRPYGDSAHYPKAHADRAEKALAAISDLLPWVQYQNARQTTMNQGLGAFADLLAAGDLPADRLVAGFEFAFYASLARSLSHDHPELASFSATSHEQARLDFQALDREIIKLNGLQHASVIARSRHVPEGTAGYRQEEFTDRQLLLREINKKKRHIALRQLMRRAGPAIQALKPCFMMGPLSVAQYLDPKAISFDLVVMDEASQLRPEEAIGAFARAKQLVVVGDPNQLPPTSFFDRLMDADDEDEDEESAAAFIGTQSILDVCEQFYPSRKLRWHYRSQHHSLIEFSNARFYEGNLIVFPSPHERNRDLGIYCHHVPSGVYQNRQNLPEAKRVVDAVVEHMMRHPERSLGVVTLNLTQRDLIEELLEQRLRSFEEGDQFIERWEKEGWPFFVKNLENVQGDERDVIFISSTFGPPGPGLKPRQNFGPISRPAGWRRLNVLFTRARQSVHLYTSLAPEDIVVGATTPRGTLELRNYLEYARSGKLAAVGHSARPPDSDFEVSVALVLNSRGYEVVPQLGVAGYFVDIAVRNPDRPGEFLAAIECDGATYHSGRSTRDRDRIRQEILEKLGWEGRIYRIWSTDWFRNRAREVTKLLTFLDKRRAEAATTVLARESNPASDESPRLFDAVAYRGEPAAAQDLVDVEALPVRKEELAVEIGDLVTYSFADQPDARLQIRIVEGTAKAGPGEVHDYAPLGKALLDLMVGEENDLDVHPSRVLRVLKIERG
ncbi:DUF4011 domain-containing protein [Cupriavidus oxalaticus]|uniref:DUF4011 domain-containing protein n=1 Tax=Cupriavidus oxalaticus TaxID=96344 RepID=A0A5P3VPT2_9BURK|nr:DUF4011 domain-containing protein [Cupriavidus oxalaticus]QEZ47473.1 DUF4011 domain-containing protein [Cupriavidus oxalaticus]